MQLFSNGLLAESLKPLNISNKSSYPNNSNMGLLKVCSWTQKVDRDCDRNNEREDNNNTVKRDFLRTPTRCTYMNYNLIILVFSFFSIKSFILINF